jgi:hypothetical protein
MDVDHANAIASKLTPTGNGSSLREFQAATASIEHAGTADAVSGPEKRRTALPAF